VLSSRTINQEILLIREGGARKTARQMNFVREDASFHARVPIHQPRCFGGVCEKMPTPLTRRTKREPMLSPSSIVETAPAPR